MLEAGDGVGHRIPGDKLAVPQHSTATGDNAVDRLEESSQEYTRTTVSIWNVAACTERRLTRSWRKDASTAKNFTEQPSISSEEVGN